MTAQQFCVPLGRCEGASYDFSHTLTQQISHGDEDSGDRTCSGAFVKY